MPRVDDKTWDEAVALARASVDIDEPIINVVKRDALPCLVELHTKFGGADVLVHRGVVFRDRGVDALGRYLRESGLLAARSLTEPDLTYLVSFLRATPARPGYDQPPLYLTGTRDELNPRLTWSDGGLELVAYFWPSDVGGGGAPVDEQVRDIEEWRLRVDDATAAWTQRTRRFDTEAGTFVD